VDLFNIVNIDPASPIGSAIGTFLPLYNAGASLAVILVFLFASYLLFRRALSVLMSANDETTAGGASWQSADTGVFGQMRMLIVQAVTILALTAGAYITVTAGPTLIVDFASDASSLVTAAPCVSAYDSRVEGKPWDTSFAKWGYNENHYPLQLSTVRDADGLTDQEYYNGKNGRPMVCLADYLGFFGKIGYILQVWAGNLILLIAIGAIFYAWVKALLKFNSVEDENGAHMPQSGYSAGGKTATKTRFGYLIETLKTTGAYTLIGIIGFYAVRYGPNLIFEIVRGVGSTISTPGATPLP
jgi:hypothetical protein